MKRGELDRIVWVVVNPSALSPYTQSSSNEYVGELLLKAEHSGDYFFDFEMLRLDAAGIGVIHDNGKRCCGYESALMHSGVKLPPQEYHRLLGGSSVDLERYAAALGKAVQVACSTYEQSLQEVAEWCDKMDGGQP